MTYTELQVTTHFSFLGGASSCEELFGQAAGLGIPALGVVDRNSLAGIVRAHEAAKATGIRSIVGCRLDLTDHSSVLVYPTDRAAYGRLCRMLTVGKGRAGKAACHLDWPDLAVYGQGIVGVLVPDQADERCAEHLRQVKDVFGAHAYLTLTLRRRPRDAARLQALANLGTSLKAPAVATNDVLYHSSDRRILQGVVTCIREGCTIDAAGFKRERHADRYLKAPAEMTRLFGRHPEAVERTEEIANLCRFSLDELTYQYPREAFIPGLTAQQALERRTWEGAAIRYPDGVPERS